MDLDSLREQIDACDREIVRLLNERARVAMEIGNYKREKGLPVYAPHREQAVYEKIAALSDGPLGETSLHAVYREIISAMIALEGPPRIAYLGPPGTWSHVAALRRFGSSVEHIPCREIRDVFLAISREHADYGIVPVENSTEGSVSQTSDMFMECDLKICSEIYVEIHQNLLARCELKDVKRIHSHPQAIAQCRNWLAANAAGVEVIEVASTTRAAEMAAREDGAAAIASDAAAAIYDLRVLEACIEDRPDNITRFVVLSHRPAGRSGRDRTSVMFSLQHESGSLADALMIFKRHGVNMTRIESRPARKRAWEYTFFIDMEGHVEDEGVIAALDALRSRSHDFVVLGSYPRAERVRPVSRPA